MQSCKKCHQRGRFRRTQVLPVCRHVAATLNDLADELVFGEPHGNAVQSRAPLPARCTEGMAVPALLDLKHQSALPFKSGSSAQELVRMAQL